MASKRSSKRMRLEAPRTGTARLLRITLIILALYIVAAFTFEVANTTHEEVYRDIVEVSNPSLFYDYASRGLVLVFFKSESCPGCRLVEPAVLRLANEDTSIRIVVAHVDKMLKVNAGATLELFSELGVYATPTFIVFHNGVEVARHVGTFGAGDQYLGLKAFIRTALDGYLAGTTSASTMSITTSDELLFNAALQVTSAFTLGLLGALAPCSLPIVLLYSSIHRERERRLLRVFISNILGIGAFAVIAGMLLVGLYIASAGLTVNPYILFIAFGASFIIAWGIEFLRGHEPLVVISGKLRRLLPLLGLQCSLPFLMAMIVLVKATPHMVIVASAMFALGYSIPYALAASLGASLLSKLESLMRNHTMLRLQGIFLITIGIYVLAENLDALFTID